MKKVVLLVAMVVLLAAIVPSNPVNAGLDLGKVLAGLQVINAFRGVSDKELTQLGNQLDEGLVNQYGTTDKGLARVQQVVHRLSPDQKLEVRVLRSAESNAMTTPGHVYITDSLLNKLSDDELAGVMAHELAHIDHGDAKKAIERSRIAVGLNGALQLAGASDNLSHGVGIAAVVGMLSYSRDDETRADQGGLEKAAKVGYNPHGLPNALSKLGGGKGGIEFLSSHPDTQKRIVALNQLADEVKIGTVGKVQKPVSKPVAISNDSRRILVKFQFTGDSYRLQEWFPRYFQLKVAEDGQVEVEAWDQDWDTVTDAQDKINDSGRYSRSTKGEVPKGRMHAPTDYYQITVDSTVKRVNVGANLFNNSNFGVNINDYVNVKVELTVQPWDVRTGRLQPGWIVSGTAKGLDGVSVNYNSGWRGQNFNVFINDVEKSLEGRAAKQAVENFLGQFSPAAKDISATGTLLLHPEAGSAIKIEIASGKYISVGDRIIFYRNDKPIAEYEVTVIDGQDLGLKTIYEKVRPTTEPFKIF